MKGRREIGVHLGLLAIAASLAGALWTRDKEPKALVSADVPVWSGRADDVERIGYDTKTRKVRLEAKRDGAGRYFVGTIEKESPLPAGAADAGNSTGLVTSMVITRHSVPRIPAVSQTATL